MKKAKYLVLIVFAVAAVSAQTGSAAVTDSTQTPVAVAVRPASGQAQSSLNRQAGVGRTTKKTNWSKIKTLFE